MSSNARHSAGLLLVPPHTRTHPRHPPCYVFNPLPPSLSTNRYVGYDLRPSFRNRAGNPPPYAWLPLQGGLLVDKDGNAVAPFVPQ